MADFTCENCSIIVKISTTTKHRLQSLTRTSSGGRGKLQESFPGNTHLVMVYQLLKHKLSKKFPTQTVY